MDHDKVTEFLGQFVTDLGAAGAAGAIALGNRLGLYGALAEGPATPSVFAERTGCHERYLTEWLRGQAVGGYVTYDAATGEFSLTEEQAFCLANPAGPNVSAGFRAVLAYLRAERRLAEAFRTGEGIAWDEHDAEVFTGCDDFYSPGYAAELVPGWIPALTGVEEKLHRGARVADLGCGLGSATTLIAQAFPRTTVLGVDSHDVSIDLARKKVADAGLSDRVTFERARAQEFWGDGFDLVTTFDSLHDMGDPVGAARAVHDALAQDGTWMVVEPATPGTGDLAVNPVARTYYAGSTFLCVPHALSEHGTHALGAQAGEPAIRQVTEAAGFTRFRRVAESAFNVVYEVKR